METTVPSQPGAATIADIRTRLATTETDMALLRRVFAYSRANGWYNSPYQAFRVSEDREVWVDVTFDPSPMVGVSRGRMPFVWYPVDSVRKAVDKLVEADVLPVEFHTAYAAHGASARVGVAA